MVAAVNIFFANRSRERGYGYVVRDMPSSRTTENVVVERTRERDEGRALADGACISAVRCCAAESNGFTFLIARKHDLCYATRARAPLIVVTVQTSGVDRDSCLFL